MGRVKRWIARLPTDERNEQMPTLQDVAAAAGVTKMTVSNVLNGRDGKVSAATKARVLAAVTQLGYIPNAAARALTMNRTNLISFIYPRQEDSSLTNAHDALFMGYLEEALRQAGYLLMIHAATDVLSAATRLRAWNVAGVVLLGTFQDEVAELRATHDVPIVFLDNYSQSAQISTVTVADEEGGYLAGRHLVELGHTTLAFVGPASDTVGVVAARRQGFTRALTEAGLALAEPHIIHADTVFAAGLQAADQLAGSAVTGVFCTADIIAAGLLKGLQEQGHQVPKDISVVGFDDLPLAAQLLPELTTIRQDIAAKANAVVELLGNQIAAESTTAIHIRLPVELRIRHSTQPPLGSNGGQA
ncbi:LacI family DNA-binding transcriptional regulator [Buchananella hordeovulneris]|uniref:LacI family DNA-binding transcriptional regulator n=1 Tax=Buchananella hordeovulneris TaxID=52770 RepID=UPI0026DACB00|nr:LacI family DNA-binding transcriptional regulator [Buchananella hordeovulneris]